MLNHAVIVKALAIASICATCASSAKAIEVTVYNTAAFKPVTTSAYELDGFGRGDTAKPGLDRPSGDASSFASSPFFDTWNINIDLMSPGNYQFTSTVVEAKGSVLFSNVAFNSYDGLGNRSTILFEISEGGKKATGSGSFSVVKPCPVQSCVWIDVFGTQDLSVGQTGYGSNLVAQIPEPATCGMLMAGLAAVFGLTKRKQVEA